MAAQVTYPWPTLTQKAGPLRGLTTIMSNDPTVGLGWLSFYMANYPTQQHGYNTVVISSGSNENQNHRFLTLRGIRREDPQNSNRVTFQEYSGRNSGSITCVSVDSTNARVLGQIEKELTHQTARSTIDLVVIDLESAILRLLEAFDLYTRLKEISDDLSVPVVVATRGPIMGEEASYLNALSVSSTTEIWIRRGPLMLPPDGKTLKLQAFRRGKLLCMLGLRANEEVGDFSEISLGK